MTLAVVAGCADVCGQTPARYELVTETIEVAGETVHWGVELCSSGDLTSLEISMQLGVVAVEADAVDREIRVTLRSDAIMEDESALISPDPDWAAFDFGYLMESPSCDVFELEIIDDSEASSRPISLELSARAYTQWDSWKNSVHLELYMLDDTRSDGATTAG